MSRIAAATRGFGRMTTVYLGGVVALAATLLAPLVTSPAAATFPGSNGKIAYYQDGDVWVQNPNGSGKDQLTTNYNAEDNPAISPDGSRIVYEFLSGIYIMHADGSGQRQLTDGTPLHEDPAWSPDGTRIVFSRLGDLWVINADGSGPVNLTKTPDFEERDAAWSPRGGKIAFETDGDGRKGARPGLFVINPRTGKGFKRILRGRGGNVDWSPNGKRLVYQSDFSADYDGSTSGGDLWTIRPNGKGRRRLLRTRKYVATVPAWAPNGKAIAFIRHSFRATGDGGIEVASSALMRIGPKSRKVRKIRNLKPPSTGEDGFIVPELAWQPLP